MCEAVDLPIYSLIASNVDLQIDVQSRLPEDTGFSGTTFLVDHPRPSVQRFNRFKNTSGKWLGELLPLCSIVRMQPVDKGPEAELRRQVWSGTNPECMS